MLERSVAFYMVASSISCILYLYCARGWIYFQLHTSLNLNTRNNCDRIQKSNFNNSF